MKKRLTFIMLAIVAIALSCGAQNHEKRMKQIRQAYADRLEIMKNNPYAESGMPFNQVGVDVAENMPGSGLHERHDKYYFTQEQYSDRGDMECTLYFATSNGTYAHGIHGYKWEFLWDSMEGDPMFALLVRTEGAARKEYRFYFENGKVIKTVPDVKQWPDKDDPESLHPFIISKPADVLKLMNRHESTFKSLLGY